MKILLFGKSGRVGWELQRSLAPLGELVALDRHAKEYCGDLGRLEALSETVQTVRPDVVVNAAAYTAVDGAEAEPDLARLINAEANGVLADATSKIGAWLVHYSTDYVFSGTGAGRWTEADATEPVNVYGWTKLEGERLIQAENPRHLIFRTSWVYASRGSSFAKSVIGIAQERDRVMAVDDQWGAPTGADLIADVTAHLLRDARLTIGNGSRWGTYHLVASGETSRYGYAKYVIQQAQRLRPDLAWAVKEIAPAPSSAFPTAARRPGNSRLDTNKLERTFGLRLPRWQQGIDRMLEETLGAV